MPIEVNALETKRFGIVAARVVDDTATPDAIDSAAQAEGVRMLTVRIDTADLARVRLLEASGFRMMDTLVYYGRETGDLPLRPACPEGVTCRLAAPADAPAVADIARAGFAAYMGHYHADPNLDSAAADAAYVEWAETSTARCCRNAPVIIADHEGRSAGFLALRMNRADEAEIVLNAVQPRMQGRGIYAVLLSEALHLAASLGALRVITSTQIDNRAVQRVWIRQGFVPIRSLHTLHKWF